MPSSVELSPLGADDEATRFGRHILGKQFPDGWLVPVVVRHEGRSEGVLAARPYTNCRPHIRIDHAVPTSAAGSRRFWEVVSAYADALLAEFPVNKVVIALPHPSDQARSAADCGFVQEASLSESVWKDSRFVAMDVWARSR